MNEHDLFIEAQSIIKVTEMMPNRGIMGGSGVAAPDESHPLIGASMTPFLGYRKILPVIEQPSDPTIRHIPLTEGYIAIVDADDYEWLSQWRWQARKKDGGRRYAYRRPYRRSGETLDVAMHRAILGLVPGDKLEGDHINRNTLDNRRSNLRAIKRQYNSWNQGVRSNNTSGYRGVIKHPSHENRWLARIMIHGKTTHLGTFKTPELAHLAYREAELKYFGEFARKTC